MVNLGISPYVRGIFHRKQALKPVIVPTEVPLRGIYSVSNYPYLNYFFEVKLTSIGDKKYIYCLCIHPAGKFMWDFYQREQN